MSLWVPPKWLRRLLVAPLVLLLAVGMVVYVPVIFLVVAVFSYRLPGQLRAFRLTGFGVVYLLLELVGLVAAFGLWIASGFGWKLRTPAFQAAHYALLGWALRVLFAAGRRLFVLRVEADGPLLPADDGDPATRERPLVIMSRHAGPADSFLLVHEVLSWAGRRPRIVLKDTLQLDPLIDVLLNRLPNRFVRSGSGRESTLEAIAELASGMTDRDAFLIFPEGGNFTSERRSRAIAALRERGLDDLAERAELMEHVLPPKPDGVLAAIAANAEADVVLVAHTGLDELDSLRDIWTAIPVHKVLQLAWAVEAHDRIPAGRPAQVRWLYDAWAGVDGWVAANREVQQLPEAR